MKLAVIVALVLLVAAAAILWPAIRDAWRAHRHRRAPWELDEESDGEQLVFHAVRPGEEPLLIGAAAFGAEDFESQMYQLRSEGKARVYALNQRNG